MFDFSYDFLKYLSLFCVSQDLHSIRVLLSGRPKDNEPMQPPARNKQVQALLDQRMLETRFYRGDPADHISLNMSNEQVRSFAYVVGCCRLFMIAALQFLDNDDDLFVERVVPHDDLHMCVKYGTVPIYDTMKHDKNKAAIARGML